MWKSTMNNYPTEEPRTYVRDNTVNVFFQGALIDVHIEGIVFQYDKGLVLNVHGIDPAVITRVCYARENDKQTVPYELLETEEEGVIACQIPDDMLEEAGILTAYLVHDDEEAGEYQTIRIVSIHIKERIPAPEI